MTATSTYVANILLREIGKSVDAGALHMLAYEAGDAQALPEAIEAVGAALRVSEKFEAPERHADKPLLTRDRIMQYVEDFPKNEYGKQQAERALAATRPAAVADMWAWLNELGGYLPKGTTP